MKKLINIQLTHAKNLLNNIYLEDIEDFKRLELIKKLIKVVDFDDIYFKEYIIDLKNMMLDILNIEAILDILDIDDFYILEIIFETLNKIIYLLENNN